MHIQKLSNVPHKELPAIFLHSELPPGISSLGPRPFPRTQRSRTEKGEGKGRKGSGKYDAPSAAIGMQAVVVLSRCKPADEVVAEHLCKNYGLRRD